MKWFDQSKDWLKKNTNNLDSETALIWFQFGFNVGSSFKQLPQVRLLNKRAA